MFERTTPSGVSGNDENLLQLNKLDAQLNKPTKPVDQLTRRTRELLAQLRNSAKDGGKEKNEIKTTIELPPEYVDELIKLVRSNSEPYARDDGPRTIGSKLSSYRIESSHHDSPEHYWHVTERYGPAKYEFSPSDQIEEFTQTYGRPSSVTITYKDGAAGYGRTEIEIIITNTGKAKKPQWEVTQAERRSRDGKERPPSIYTYSSSGWRTYERQGTEEELVDFNIKNKASSPEKVGALVREVFTPFQKQ